MSRKLARIEIVEDRSEGSRLDEGFLRLRRLRLENVYEDGTRSAPYACDVVSRRAVDAVAVVIHGPRWDGGVHVALRTGVRPPVHLRVAKGIAHDPGTPAMLAEIVAGVLEPGDAHARGVAARAAAECLEEAGYVVEPEAMRPLGGAAFPSPGVTDERVHFRRVEVDLETRVDPSGDGSVMEEAGELVVLPLAEAIRRCRRGDIPDMKTEVALLRLADVVGYLPALDCYVADLPEDVRADLERRGPGTEA